MPGEASTSASRLFNSTGDLRLELFSEDSRELLDECLDWVNELDRGVILPIDFVVALLRAGAEGIENLLGQVMGIPRRGEALLYDLESHARQVERPLSGSARLHIDAFSLGSVGILHDSYTWSTEVGRDLVTGADLIRAVRWRIEYQESASIRWVLKQLGQSRTEQLFDDQGLLIPLPFGESLWGALNRAAELSSEAGLPFVGTPQLIAALCTPSSTLLAATASDVGIRPERLQSELLRIVGNRTPSQPQFQITRKTLTPRVIRMLESAVARSRVESRTCDEVDLLAEFLEDGGSSLELIRALGIERSLRKRLQKREDARSGNGGGSRILPSRAPSLSSGGSANAHSNEDVLETVGRDLSELASRGELPAVLGRDRELAHILRILMRTEQRNPLLTGEPGVGKTALAMALAQKIHDREVPEQLRDARVIEINSAALLGGTSYRGELEARITRLIERAEEERAILFIDEAHTIFAPTSGAGRPAETPNHFKTALASGRIAVIAATTTSEFRRWIEEDPALKRRFEQIAVDELSPVTTRRLLLQLAKEYEERWTVEIPESVVDDVIQYSTRYIPQRSQPDKAKKLLMDTAIQVRLSNASGDLIEKPMRLSREDVASVVHEKTRIPVERMLEDSLAWWQTLERRVSERIPEQESAAHELSRKLFQRRFRPGASNKPYGAVAIMSPIGVDAEDFARTVAIECFGSHEAFTRIDMGDLTEAHSMTRLFGAPPGYVGYADEDLLITPLRQRPAQVIFLADFDEAHPRVQERLLRLMNDATARDTRGFEADLRHACFFFEVPVSSDANAIGFGQSSRPDARGQHADLFRKFDSNGVSSIQLSNPIRARDARRDHVRRVLERFVEHARIDDQSVIEQLLISGQTLADELPDEATLPELDIAVFDQVIEPLASKLFEDVDLREEDEKTVVDQN